jgi:hypothetical protein
MRIPGFGGGFVDMDEDLAEKLETALADKNGDIR